MIVEVRGKKLSVEKQGAGEPVVLLHGLGSSANVWDAVSPVANGEGLVAEVPTAKLKIIEQCGHWHPIEQPAEVSKALAEFL